MTPKLTADLKRLKSKRMKKAELALCNTIISTVPVDKIVKWIPMPTDKPYVKVRYCKAKPEKRRKDKDAEWLRDRMGSSAEKRRYRRIAARLERA